MKKIFGLFFIGLFFLTAAVSCKKDEPSVTANTVLIYIAANNNLYYNAYDLVEQLKDGYLPDIMDKSNNLLIYFHTTGDKPLLCKMNKRSDGQIDSTVICVYDSATNSASAEQFSKVLRDAEHFCPSTRHSLIFWSHGTGYVPEGYSPEYRTKAVGYDDSYETEIEIPEFASALLPVKYDFILFDCCLMGGIEVAYELRDATSYLVFSPTEIMSKGFPYYNMMEKLFQSASVEEGLVGVAKEYYNFYLERYYQTMSSWKPEGGTVSVVKTEKLDDIAAQAKPLFSKYHSALYSLESENVQRYYQGTKYWFYDLSDIVANVATSEESAAFDAVLSKAIVYKAATPKFQTITIDKYCGLSCYLPDAGFTKLNAYYKTLKWNEATGLVQ